MRLGTGVSTIVRYGLGDLGLSDAPASRLDTKCASEGRTFSLPELAFVFMADLTVILWSLLRA